MGRYRVCFKHIDILSYYAQNCHYESACPYKLYGLKGAVWYRSSLVVKTYKLLENSKRHSALIIIFKYRRKSYMLSANCSVSRRSGWGRWAQLEVMLCSVLRFRQYWSLCVLGMVDCPRARPNELYLFKRRKTITCDVVCPNIAPHNRCAVICAERRPV